MDASEKRESYFQPGATILRPGAILDCEERHPVERHASFRKGGNGRTYLEPSSLSPYTANSSKMKSYEESQSRRYQKARGFPDARGRGARAVS